MKHQSVLRRRPRHERYRETPTGKIAPWIDISIDVESGMVHWPGDPIVTVTPIRDIKRGDEANISALTLSSHTGTHMDAPLHFLPGGKGIDRLPLDVTLGPARIIAIEDETAITRTELKKYHIRPGERLLFKTRNSGLWKKNQFVKEYVYLSKEAAEDLASLPVRLVGIDYLSIGSSGRDGAEIHQILLEKGVWILEGLNFSDVHAGPCELACLPLKLVNGDGAPARAVVRYV